MTSPSSGIVSPASTSTTSPLRSAAAATADATARRAAARSASWRRSFCVMPRSDRRLRLAAAFGHRLGEVREQHREPEPERDREDEAGRRLARGRRAPGSTRHGREDRCRRRRRTSPGCATARAGRACANGVGDAPAANSAGSKSENGDAGRGAWRFSRLHRAVQVLDDRAERERRHEGQRADEQHGADQQQRRRAGRASAACRRSRRCASWRPASRRSRAPARSRRSGRTTSRCRAPRCRTACSAERPAKALPLLLAAEREARRGSRRSRARPGWRCRPGRRRRATATRGAGEHQERRHQDGERRHLHLVRLDLLAEVLGRAADHQAGDEDGEDREHQHAVEARADAAEDDLAELHQRPAARGRRAA